MEKIKISIIENNIVLLTDIVNSNTKKLQIFNAANCVIDVAIVRKVYKKNAYNLL